MMLGLGLDTRGVLISRDPINSLDPRSNLDVSLRPTPVEVSTTYPMPVSLAPPPGYVAPPLNNQIPPPAVFPVSPVAGTPAPIGWAEFDRAVPYLIAAIPDDLSGVATDMLQQLCAACANPAAALANKLGSQPLADGVTIDGVIARYQGQINYACSRFAAELAKRGQTAACGNPAAGSSGSGSNSNLLILAAAGVALFWFLGRGRN